jgi:hypothetical protein
MVGYHHDAWLDGWMIEDGSMNGTPSVPHDGYMKRTVGCMSHGRCGVGDGRSYLVICSVMQKATHCSTFLKDSVRWPLQTVRWPLQTVRSS